MFAYAFESTEARASGPINWIDIFTAISWTMIPLKKRSLFISRSCFSNLTHRWSGYIMMIQRDSHSVTQLGFKLTHLEIVLEISLVTFHVTKMTISYHKWIPLLPSYIFGPIRFGLS